MWDYELFIIKYKNNSRWTEVNNSFGGNDFANFQKVYILSQLGFNFINYKSGPGVKKKEMKNS